ncbi:MAG: hypothetical protein ACYDAQ_01280 [Mycobacteriales bacterium]
MAVGEDFGRQVRAVARPVGAQVTSRGDGDQEGGNARDGLGEDGVAHHTSATVAPVWPPVARGPRSARVRRCWLAPINQIVPAALWPRARASSVLAVATVTGAEWAASAVRRLASRRPEGSQISTRIAGPPSVVARSAGYVDKL